MRLSKSVQSLNLPFARSSVIALVRALPMSGSASISAAVAVFKFVFFVTGAVADGVDAAGRVVCALGVDGVDGVVAVGRLGEAGDGVWARTGAAVRPTRASVVKKRFANTDFSPFSWERLKVECIGIQSFHILSIVRVRGSIKTSIWP